MDRDEEEGRSKKISNSPESGYDHLKWPAIILIILILLLVLVLNHFYRTGDI